MSRRTAFVFKKLLSLSGGGSPTSIRSLTTLIPGDGAAPPLVTHVLDKWCNENVRTYVPEHYKKFFMFKMNFRRHSFAVDHKYYDDDDDGNEHSNEEYPYDDDFRYDNDTIHPLVSDQQKLAASQVVCFESFCEWKQLFQTFIDTNKLVVVEFGVSWLRPILAKIAKKTPHVIFMKVDADELNSAAKEYNIKALPSFVFFKEGREIDRLVFTKEDLAAKIIHHSGGSA